MVFSGNNHAVCEDSEEEDVTRISRQEHPNIVSFIGLSKDNEAIMLEYVELDVGKAGQCHSLHDLLTHLKNGLDDYVSSILTIACQASEI